MIIDWSAVVSPIFLHPYCHVYGCSCISCKMFCKLYLRYLCKVRDDTVAS